MIIFNVKKITAAAVLGLGLFVLGAVDTNAQTWRERERQRIERQRIEQQRQWERQNSRRDRRRYDVRQNRETSDNPGRFANRSVQMGYDFGFQAGLSDRRSGKYNRSNVYRNTGSSPNSGDPTSADYLYRQGYLQGYDDGFYGRRQY